MNGAVESTNMMEVGAVTVTRRGRHEQHEWHFRNTWRQALCDLCLRLTLWHAMHVEECINPERGLYYTSPKQPLSQVVQ